MWCKRLKIHFIISITTIIPRSISLKIQLDNKISIMQVSRYFSIPICIAFKSSILQKLLRCFQDKIACMYIAWAFSYGYKSTIQYWLTNAINYDYKYHTNCKSFQINNRTMLKILSALCFPLGYDFFSWWNSRDIAKTRIGTRQLLLKFLSLTWKRLWPTIGEVLFHVRIFTRKKLDAVEFCNVNTSLIT